MVSVKHTIRGTREWAVAGVNCCTGCSHGCRYCYARYDNVVKRGVVAPEQWSKHLVRLEDVEREYPLYPGTVMFPTEHDIHPEILDPCIEVLRNLVQAGNRILVVSKPYLSCIRKICDVFAETKDQILFRFTITAKDDTILRFWEPCAPSYQERLDSLRHGFENGYSTSVSIEPMLDADNIADLIEDLSPLVNHSIWLGKMNKIEQRVDCADEPIRTEIERIRKSQSDEKIVAIFEQFRHNRLIRWKESIKELVGIEPAKRPGEDI